MRIAPLAALVALALSTAAFAGPAPLKTASASAAGRPAANMQMMKNVKVLTVEERVKALEEKAQKLAAENAKLRSDLDALKARVIKAHPNLGDLHSPGDFGTH